MSRCITDRREVATVYPSEGGKARDGIATNHSSCFLFVFFFLPPPLIFVLEERKNEKRGEMEDNSLEFHRDQHFSIRRIIHFFSPLSIGRSLPSPLSLSLPIAVGRFFLFFLLRVQPPGHYSVLVDWFSKY